MSCRTIETNEVVFFEPMRKDTKPKPTSKSLASASRSGSGTSLNIENGKAFSFEVDVP